MFTNLENLLRQHYTVADTLKNAQAMLERIDDGVCATVQCAAVPVTGKPERYTDEQWDEITGKIAFIQVDPELMRGQIIARINQLEHESNKVDKELSEINDFMINNRLP